MKLELFSVHATYQSRSLSFIILFSLIWSLTNCTAGGKPFQRGEPVSGKSSLYLYYAHGPFSSSFAWPVFLDGQNLTELKRGWYFYTTVSPGIHTVSMKLTSVEQSLNVKTEADGTYYLRLRYETKRLAPIWVLEPVSETQALNELKDMKLQQGTGEK